MVKILHFLLLLSGPSSSLGHHFIKASPWSAPEAHPSPSPVEISSTDYARIAALPGPLESFHLPHTYLISFQPNTPKEVQQEHITWIKSLEPQGWEVEQHERLVEQQKRRPQSKAEWRNTSPERGLIVLRHVFELFHPGYSAVIMDEAILDAIRRKSEVEKLERVGITEAPGLPLEVYASDSIISPPAMLRADQTPSELANMQSQIKSQTLNPEVTVIQNRGWNTVRISHRNFTTGYNAGPWARDRFLGKGVTVYVLDTGINLAHPGFKGSNVTFGKDFLTWKSGGTISPSETDNHGHGTMCAGVIAGGKHGISPEAHTVAVKIADDENRSACDDVVAGIEWVTSQPGSNNMKVISMSHYGFTGKPDVTTAVSKAIENGVHFVASAGNDGRDACGFQPSNALGVISVGSVNGLNKFPVKGTEDAAGGLSGKEVQGTNMGTCVTIFGPGTKVPTLSTKNLEPDFIYWSWGTSIAAPQVAAVISNRLSKVGPQSPAEINSWLVNIATKGQIEEKDLKGSPNLILYTGVDSKG